MSNAVDVIRLVPDSVPNEVAVPWLVPRLVPYAVAKDVVVSRDVDDSVL